MSDRPSKGNQALPSLLIPRADADAQLQARIELGEGILNHRINSDEALTRAQEQMNAWTSYNVELLSRIFDNSAIADEYNEFFGASIPMNPSLQTLIWEFERDMEDKISRLRSIHGRLELIPVLATASGNASETPASPSQVLRTMIRRFPRVARQLANRDRNRPPLLIEDEYDAQYLLHALLRLNFDDVRPEDYVPTNAGGASRVDFLLKDHQIVLEVKYASENLRDAQVGAQLLIDIGRYQSHTDCKTLYCFVYDPHSCLTNPEGIEADLSGMRNGVDIVVLVEPK